MLKQQVLCYYCAEAMSQGYNLTPRSEDYKGVCAACRRKKYVKVYLVSLKPQVTP